MVIVAVVGHCARSYSGGHPESVNPASWAAVVAAIAIAMVITASVMLYILASIVPYIPMSVVPYIPMSVVPYVPANVMTLRVRQSLFWPQQGKQWSSIRRVRQQ